MRVAGPSWLPAVSARLAAMPGCSSCTCRGSGGELSDELGQPVSGGVSGDSGEVHAATVVLDDEENVEAAQKHERQRGPGERANAKLKNWKVLRKIRSSPNQATELVAAVQTLMIASA
jgi:hypothetical protein